MIDIRLQKGSRAEIKIKDKVIGPSTFTVIAGPCTIQSKKTLSDIADHLSRGKISFLRGGSYKMRTSPYSFQGIGQAALEYLSETGKKFNMITVSEIVSEADIKLMSEKIDIIQVGTRNMQNYALLKKLGSVKNPVILKRGMSSTIEEWLLAAEHLLKAGNRNVILCERGIRTFENMTRNTLDLSSIPVIRQYSNLPVLVDPSHSTGLRDLIKPLSWAAAAVGADGLIIEVHPCPDESVCDSDQTIDFSIFEETLKELPGIIKLWDKKLV